LKKSKFMRLPRFETEKDIFGSTLRIGDKFLFGLSLVSQTEKKNVDDEITYLEVTDKPSKSNVVYTYRITTMKEG